MHNSIYTIVCSLMMGP